VSGDEGTTFRAAVPAALTSIFSPKLMDGDRLRTDPALIGARGGGFALEKGVETWVTVRDGERKTHVSVNDADIDFPPSYESARVLRNKLGFSGTLSVQHKIAVPIGTGFGTSAAAALGILIAGSFALGKPITMTEAIRLTHEVELRCRTGLNSEAGMAAGGLVLVRHEGAPPNLIVDALPLPAGIHIVSVVAGQLKTEEVIGDMARMKAVERIGDSKLERIHEELTLENFLKQANEFAWEAGFVTQQVREIFSFMESRPIIGCAQNMLGNAAHAVVDSDFVPELVEELRERFPRYTVLDSRPVWGVCVERLP